MPKRHDYLIVGSALIDIIVETKSLEKVDVSKKYVEYLLHLSAGSKTRVENLNLSSGGSALNVAITMDCMGSRSAFLTCLGKNVFGDFILKKLRTSNINTSYVKRTDTNTGVGINLISGGEKSALVYHGAVDLLGENDVTPSMIENSKHILITSLTSKKNYGLFLKTLKLAKKYSVPVIFAPGITMLKEFERKLRNLKYVFDVIILNYEEGSFLTKKKDVKSILKSLPGRVVVVTKDKEGAYAKDGNKFVHVTSLPVKVKNTTGAGDVFCGAFVYTYYESGLENALKMATAVAGMKLGRMEAEVQCFPPQILKFLKAYEKKIRISDI
ncbi:hypothetical protein CMO88_04915 [Candidatus Woesearchaeota archaeon]|nr:hypothetical protein [Candidatus Woesearchaeota archaeon]|tara:strand:- start:18236 stop:19216 length:981 start_codon:yes stop_codon:yes gene_type:complete